MKLLLVPLMQKPQRRSSDSQKIQNLKKPAKLKFGAFCLLAALLIVVLLPKNCFAHPKASDHYKDIEKVLFESGFSKYKSNDVKEATTCLEKASQLTIDQFGGSQEGDFKYLKKAGMHGLPMSFSSIDYSNDFHSKDKNINANTHRYVTHQGWNQSRGKEEQKFWNNRKKVMLGTADTIFDFDDKTLLGSSKKCDALCELIYYVHILGDYAEADNYKKISLLPDLAGSIDENKPDLISAIKNDMTILFPDQKQFADYKDLVRELDKIYKPAEKLKKSVGGVNTDEEFIEYHEHAAKVMENLQKYIPSLLKNEKFFKDVFYAD